MSVFKRVFVGSGMLAVLAACEHGDPVSSAGTPSGKAVLLSGTPRADKLPGGSAAITYTFGGFNPAIRDLFGRKQADPVRARRTRNFRGTAHYWTWTRELRDGTPNRQDPRTPTISPSSTIANGNQYLELYQPEGAYPNKEFWELYAYVENLTPNTPHEIAFVHRRLTVNGTLDVTDRLINGTVTAPDQLTMGPGTKATTNTNWSSSAPAGCADFPGVTANPYVVSTDASAGDGHIEIDKCWKSGNGIWTKAEYDQQTKSMVGRADDTTYTLPNYNYIEIWQGAFGTGTLMGRVQIAQDLAPDGTPVKDAYPPFPSPGGAHSNTQMGPIPAPDAATAYPLTSTQKTALPGAIGAPETVVATLINLQRLEAPVYKAWFVNPSTGVAKEAAGSYVRKVGTETVETVASTSTFKGGPGTITFTTTYDQAVHGPFSDSLTFLLITRENDAAATTPSSAQALWVKIFKVPPATAGGAISFGTFNRDQAGGATPVSALGFTPQGVASGGLLGEAVTESRMVDGKLEPVQIFVGSVIQMQFTNLQRPPKGYEYLAYFRFKRDTTAETPTTVVRDSSLFLIGSPKGPAGESLANADVDPSGGNLGPTSIRTARITYDAHSRAGGQLCDYDRFRLYLVPKGGVVTEPTSLIFDIPLPERVTKAASCR